MSEVKRFFTALGFDPEPYVDMIEDGDGNYVYYEDYEALRAQLAEAQKEIERLKDKCGHESGGIRTHLIKNDFGYCCYAFENENPSAVIFNLYIYKQYRKRGEARKLLQSAISAIRDTGYTGKIVVNVEPQENSISVDALTSFYKTMGLNILEPNNECLFCAIIYDLKTELSVKNKELTEWDLSFKLYDDAIRRGTNMFREAHPDYTERREVPSTDKLVMWLLEELKKYDQKKGQDTSWQK